jgi:hypothetical protein
MVFSSQRRVETDAEILGALERVVGAAPFGAGAIGADRDG